MHKVPQPYICPVCHTKMYAEKPNAACMKCFAEFVLKHVPMVVPDPDGKPFDPASNIAYC